MDDTDFNPEQMEIKRQIEMIVATNRRVIVHGLRTSEQTFCAECGGATLRAEQAANFFQIKQRVIFQLIERSMTHFNETETGAVMICLPALTSTLRENESLQISVKAK